MDRIDLEPSRSSSHFIDPITSYCDEPAYIEPYDLDYEGPGKVRKQGKTFGV